MQKHDRHGVPVVGCKGSSPEIYNPPGRPAPEVPDPVVVARLEEFLARLEDTSIPITRSPLEEFRANICGFTRHEGSGYFGPYSYSAWCAIEAGARETLPAAVVQTLKRLGGPSAAARFEEAWRRWRAKLGREVIEAAERKLFPAGGAFGMVG